MSIEVKAFGQFEDQTVYIYTLKNTHGTVVRILNYGGIIQSLEVSDRNSELRDIVLGFNTLEEYLELSPHFGCITGRYANRIANGQFSIGAESYQLAQNNGKNCLHGGLLGLDKKLWQAELFDNKLSLSHTSPDGDEQFPGNLSVTVCYELNNDNQLLITYSATTDKDTVINLTNHSYFNLNGAGNGDILAHRLRLDAPSFTPVNEALIPTGEIQSVGGTPLDFTSSQLVGERIEADDEQLVLANGYDHNWVLDNDDANLLEFALLESGESGIFMKAYTTEPGVQFYTGNFLDGTFAGKEGKIYYQRYGLCLETQHYPDSPNHEHFPTTLLKVGDTYNSQTIYEFGHS